MLQNGLARSRGVVAGVGRRCRRGAEQVDVEPVVPGRIGEDAADVDVVAVVGREHADLLAMLGGGRVLDAAPGDHFLATAMDVVAGSRAIRRIAATPPPGTITVVLQEHPMAGSRAPGAECKHLGTADIDAGTPCLSSSSIQW